MKQLVLVAALLLTFAAGWAAADETIDSREFLANARKSAANSCQIARSTLTIVGSKQDKAAENAQLMVHMNCECVPEGLDHAESLVGKQIPEKMGRSEVDKLIKPHVMSKCAGEQYRNNFGANCPANVKSKVADPAAYCACMSRVAAGFSDLELYELTTTAYANFQKKVEARKNNQPAPEPIASESFKRLEAAEAQCRVPAAAAPKPAAN